MKIVALSDIHRNYEKAKDILRREQECDLIVICGDITTHGHREEAKKALEDFIQYGRPILAISGNMDSKEIDSVIEEMGCSINGKGVIIEDVGFWGVPACPFSLLHTPYEISEEEVYKIAEEGWKDVERAHLKVMVSHAPPYNTKLDKIFLGKHVGSESIRKFVLTHSPDVLICGHIHEARGKDVLGKTQMINCGPAAHGYYAKIEISETIKIENCG